ncbi:chaplin family protein [Streptosporangium sp. NPDC001559]|uniref:chaplin family protein n=1 Tax=Streptosporangium sp. NPDC001559 TaxID=3366187 RepID=UPI0036ECB1A9
MRMWVKGTAPAALLALGVMSLGSGTAFADTDGGHSVGGGNQIQAPITLPVDISGNAATVGGKSTAVSQGGASATEKGGIPGKTSGRSSVLGGNQVNAPVTAPVNACGNAASIIGGSVAACRGGASVVKRGRGAGGAGGNRTDGTSSVLGGNQVTAPVTAPANVCGNAIAIFGDTVAGCRGGASVIGSGGRGGAGGNTTSGRSSVLGGNQVTAPVTAPANVCGLAVGAVGNAFSGCTGGAEVPGAPARPNTGYAGAGRPGAGGNTASGTSGVAAGNQVTAPITAPVNVCGTAVAVAGDAAAGCVGGSSINGFGAGRGAGGNTTSGRSGVVAGNQVTAPVAAPVNVCGTAVAVAGDAFAGCRGGSSAGDGYGRGAGGNRTDGTSGVAAGNQVTAPVAAPVNACGNAVAALGDAAAGCLGGSRVGNPVGSVAGVPVGAHQAWRAYGKGNPPAPAAPPAVPPAVAPRVVGGLLSVLPAPVKGLIGRVKGVLPTLPQTPVGSRPRPASAGLVDGLLGRGGIVGVTRTSQSAPQAVPQSAPRPAQGKGGSLLGGKDLPVDAGLPVGLMSAAQPIGVTGMNSGSLFALLLGAMAAASAALFVTARRIRFAKK